METRSTGLMYLVRLTGSRYHKIPNKQSIIIFNRNVSSFYFTDYSHAHVKKEKKETRLTCRYFQITSHEWHYVSSEFCAANDDVVASLAT